MEKKQINDDSPIITLAVAADLLGLHSRTLMLYEYEQLVIPYRNNLKHRIYSKNQVREIEFVQYLTKVKRMNFAGIRIVKAMIEAGKERGIDLKSEIFPDFKPGI